ncbi:uncharacterized protein [Pseudorasbora parva]|uniref:uncharacterized protein n=1 Tax=Pseudorasbora parva TaxID=51549 RepID=UPI00351EC72C
MRSHQNTQRPASSMQTSTQATVRSIRFASNPRQIQPAAAAATASLSAAESGRVSVAAANISSAVSSGSFMAAPTVNVTFPPATVPPNALAMNPPPVSTHLRSQILAGADFDLSSLLPSVSISEPNRTLDFGPLTINLKTPNSKPNRIFTMAEFCIAFEKTQGPTTSLEFLGINLDSVKFQASLPKDKIDRIIAISSNLLEAPQCSKRDLLSLLEIQSISPGGGPKPNPSSSLFRLDIPVTHPLRDLHTSSLDLIFHAISPRTLQSYWTAWKAFKQFHSFYNQFFPNFSLLSISSFISYLHKIKSIQPSTIKVYLSGIQFFFKLIYGHPCPAITNPQISLLIKGIQKTNPTHPDSRQPLTSDLLAKCLTFLRSGHMPPDTARTLDAMFPLAFFGFLRVSEFTTNSKFNPTIHPTFSDLQVLDKDTIRFLIKRSKTDQFKNGHFIHIFNLPTPIQPYQSLSFFLAHREAQISSQLDPLFIDENNLPITRHWFHKKLKYILTNSGIQAHLYSSHSFRIGAATTAAQKGLPDHQIKLLGRWSSDAFQSYIRSDLCLIKQAHLKLASL